MARAVVSPESSPCMGRPTSIFAVFCMLYVGTDVCIHKFICILCAGHSTPRMNFEM